MAVAVSWAVVTTLAMGAFRSFLGTPFVLLAHGFRVSNQLRNFASSMRTFLGEGLMMNKEDPDFWTSA